MMCLFRLSVVSRGRGVLLVWYTAKNHKMCRIVKTTFAVCVLRIKHKTHSEDSYDCVCNILPTTVVPDLKLGRAHTSSSCSYKTS